MNKIILLVVLALFFTSCVDLDSYSVEKTHKRTTVNRIQINKEDSSKNEENFEIVEDQSELPAEELEDIKTQSENLAAKDSYENFQQDRREKRKRERRERREREERQETKSIRAEILPIVLSYDAVVTMDYDSSGHEVIFTVEPNDAEIKIKAAIDGVVEYKNNVLKITQDNFSVVMIVDDSANILVKTGDQVKKNDLVGNITERMSFYVENDGERKPLCINLNKTRDLDKFLINKAGKTGC